jgi:iron complex outermembrane recepter protein
MKAKIFLAASACIASIAISDAAFAQQATDTAAQTADVADSNGMGSDIVVTARRRAEDIGKVPVSITAFSDKQLQVKNIVNLADLTKVTPGLNITGGGTRTNVFITIRGQSRGVTGNVSPGVLTYFNEVPMPTYGSTIPTYDMDNIQVLKGPQGTLFGRNSIGGAVLTYSKAPTSTFEGYVKGEIGEYANRNVEGAVNVPIVPDVVALRVAGSIGRSGGYTKSFIYTPYTVNGLVASPGVLNPSATHNADEYDTTSFRGSLLIQPSDAIKNVTVYDYTRVRGQASALFDTFYPAGANGGTPAIYLLPPASILGAAAAGNFGAPPFGDAIANNLIGLAQCGTSIACDYKLFQAAKKAAGPGVSFSGTDPWQAVTTIWGISNTTTIDLADHLRIKNIFGYRTTDTLTVGDIDGTPMALVDTRQRIRQKVITEELQLSGSLMDDKLKYTLGGFYFKQAPNGLGGSAGLEISAFLGLSHTTSVSYFTDTSKALYGQIDYSLDSIVPGLSLTAGYRQTWDKSGGCVMALGYTPFDPPLVMESATDPIPSEDTCRAGTLKAKVNNSASSVSSAILPQKSFKKGTYNFGLNWQVSPSALIYVATRKGYRAGSYNSPLYDGYLSGVQTFSPETLTDYEIGTKLRWDSGDMSGSFDFAGFIGKDKDMQLPIPTSNLSAASVACIAEAATWPGSTATPCTTAGGAAGRRVTIPAATTYNNAGDATISGFEAAATISPVPGLVLGGGLSYVHVKTDRIQVNANLVNVLTANGRAGVAVPTVITLRQQPKWTATGSLYYEHQDRVLGGHAFVNLDLRYRSSFSEGEDTITAATSVDARLGINDIGGTGVDAALNVVNLFNKLYDYGTVGSALSSGYRTTLRAAPRTVSVSLRYHWGS